MPLLMATAEGRIPLRCTHCGREVAETLHTRASYHVDYYLLHTGDVQPTTVARPDDPAGVMTILKLSRVNIVVTCAECYRQPGVQEERELLFRPEQAQAVRQEEGQPS
jgi:hypothetical protein